MRSVLFFRSKATTKVPSAVYCADGAGKNGGSRKESMTAGRVRALVLGAAVALTVSGAAPSAIAASFDGVWSLLVVSPDHCGTTRWNLAIRGGQVNYPDGYALGGYPVYMAGRVSPSGVIRVNVAAGPRYASGAGRLGKFQGSGRWAGQGPSGTCAGVWIATRVNTYRAGASGPYVGASGPYVGYPYGPYAGYPSWMIPR